jgi:uncharacterized protein YggU (UPF0235/DUF167 family)
VTGARKAPWRTRADGVQVFVRVTPKSACDCVEGTMQSPDGPALKVRVRAVADKGEANRAVETVVAEWLGVARTSVSLGAGGKSRLKTLHVAGEPLALERLLRARLGELA